MIDILQLKYALRVAEHLNFTKAAEVLFISQPSLSNQIKKLEEELGFRIFLRDSKKVSITSTGKTYLESAAKVVKEYDNLQMLADRILGDLSNQISLGSNPFNAVMISQSLPVLRSEIPNVYFKLIEAGDSDIIRMILDKQLDLALVSLTNEQVSSDTFECLPITTEELMVICNPSHPFAQREFVSLEEMGSYEILASHHRTATRVALENALRAAGISGVSFLELSSVEARKPYLDNGAISFSLNTHSAWRRFDDSVAVPVLPKITTTLAIIRARNARPSYILNTVSHSLQRELRTYFQINERL